MSEGTGSGSNKGRRGGVVWFIVGALVVAVAVLGYIIYEDSRKEAGFSVEVTDDGIDVETD